MLDGFFNPIDGLNVLMLALCCEETLSYPFPGSLYQNRLIRYHWWWHSSLSSSPSMALCSTRIRLCLKTYTNNYQQLLNIILMNFDESTQGISIHKNPGPWFNIKMPSYHYRKSHCGDKTIFRTSYHHSGISYTDKMASLYWIRALVFCDVPVSVPGRLKTGTDRFDSYFTNL